MKEVNFDKVQVGDLVQVPRTQFAPMRRGWNGWLFSDAIVTKKGISQKTHHRVIAVKMMVPAPHDGYNTIDKVFRDDCVFETNGVQIAKSFLEKDGVKSKSEFWEFTEREDVTGCGWIKFLVDNGFLFGEVNE